MRLLERIVVPVDFGCQTDSVIASAIALARQFGSEVHLLHVLPELDELSSSEMREILSMAREAAEQRLAQIGDRLGTAGVSTTTPRVAHGCPFDQIIQYAEETDANVILVGSRAEERSGGLRLGTTAERLFRKSPKPVWVVDPESRVAPRTILCAVDGSPPSKRALQNAIHLARQHSARLYVLHVTSPVSVDPELLRLVPRGMNREHAEAEAAGLERFLASFDFHGIERQVVLREGNPAEAILVTASELSVDLLVMGSVGRTGLSRILLGSVAGKVARQLPCSVVMVKAEDAIRLRLDEELADLHTHYARGCELLENGFPEEARRQFEHCMRTNDMFAPAWDGLAEVCQRQGRPDRANEHRETAQQIKQALAWQRVEADVRRSHLLWSKD